MSSVRQALKTFLSGFTVLTLIACSTVRLQGEASAISGDTAATVTLEKSYETRTTKTWCAITAIFYGGACWAYLFMPTHDQKEHLRSDLNGLIVEKLGGKEFELEDLKVKRLSWSDEDPTFQMGAPQKVVSLKEQARKIIDKLYGNRKLYAGPDLIDSIPGDPIKILDFDVLPISTNRLITLALHLEQKKSKLSLEIEIEFGNEGEVLQTFISNPGFDDPAREAIYTRDPLAKYRNQPRVVQAVRERKTFVGMPSEAVLVSFGKPDQVNTTATAKGRVEQWVYSNYNYVYVSNGLVTAWQSSN